jgi:hypothetical protein
MELINHEALPHGKVQRNKLRGEDTLRVMVIVKANADSEKGVLPPLSSSMPLYASIAFLTWDR